VGGENELSPGALVQYALVLGTIGGAAEALYLALRQLIAHQPAAWYNPDTRWMAPIVAGLLSALLGAVLAALAWAGRSGVDLSKATFLFAFTGTYAVAQSPGIPLHPIAKVVLSLGIASVLARAADGRAARIIASIRRVTLAATVALIALAAWGLATLPPVAERRALSRLPPARAGSPNVLLLILDTVRAANLGLYGYHRPTSPTLDRWAGAGVVFDRAIVTAPWTLPSHASMFTGHYNVTARTGIDRPLDRRLPTIAEVLRDHGYATAGFTANLGYTTRTSGLARGFARFEDFPVTMGIVLPSTWLGRMVSNHLWWLPGMPTWPIPKTAERITDDFQRWLDGRRQGRRQDRPFFVFLNYYDAHGPYLSPPAYRARFGPPAETEATSDKPWTTEELATSINAYDGSIAYVDDQLKRVFALLDASGLRDSTLVVVTSDHGEMFGEHGQTAHTSGLYMPALRVPLAMVYPGVVPGGVRVMPPVTLRDLPATILDIIGLAAESPIPGQSLAAHWKPGPNSGPNGGENPDGKVASAAGTASPILSEIDHYAWAPSWTPIRRGDMRSLVEGRLHYIRNGDGVEELYDPVADPAETRNLIADAALQPSVARFRATLDSIFRP
jgi:arylsulfatase A-like enzyme